MIEINSKRATDTDKAVLTDLSDVRVRAGQLTTWLTVGLGMKSIIYNRFWVSKLLSHSCLPFSSPFLCILWAEIIFVDPSHNALTVFTVFERQENIEANSGTDFVLCHFPAHFPPLPVVYFVKRLLSLSLSGFCLSSEITTSLRWKGWSLT